MLAVSHVAKVPWLELRERKQHVQPPDTKPRQRVLTRCLREISSRFVCLRLCSRWTVSCQLCVAKREENRPDV